MAEKAKKKGGKLPIILVAVLVVAGGGFFAMGKKAPEKKEEPKPELGAVQSLGDQFLINLADGRTFLVCDISVQVDKHNAHIADPAAGGGGDHGEGGGESTFAIARDAVNTVLTGKQLSDITRKDGLKFLKREIAAAINHALHAAHPAEEKKVDPKEEFKKSKGESEAPAEDSHPPEIDNEWLDHIGMDSEEGPVLKVFFDSFTYHKR